MISELLVTGMCAILDCLPLEAVGLCPGGSLRLFAADSKASQESRALLKSVFPKRYWKVNWDKQEFEVGTQFVGLGKESIAPVSCESTLSSPVMGGEEISSCGATASVTLGAILVKGNGLHLLTTDHGLVDDQSVVRMKSEKLSEKGTPLAGGLSAPDAPVDVSAALILGSGPICPQVACKNGPRFSGWVKPAKDDMVSKCGSRTGMRVAKVECPVLACVKADIEGRVMEFHDQILIKKGGGECSDPFAVAGDSGAVVFKVADESGCLLQGLAEAPAVGLLFAKSKDNVYYLATPMKTIFDKLGAGYKFLADPVPKNTKCPPEP